MMSSSDTISDLSKNPNRHTILLVDDESANLATLTTYLAECNYRILVARTGESGLDIARRASPDLILLDVMLPGIDGFNVCRQLKAEIRTRDIPVIFMTIVTGSEEKVRGFKAGGVDYITKPFQHGEVLARVATHLRIRGLTQQLEKAKESLELQVEEQTAALRDSEERLRLTMEAVNIGSWDWDVQHDIWYPSPIYYTMLGYEPKAGPGDRQEWLARVHPDDRTYVTKKIQDVLISGLKEFHYEARLRHADGTYRWQEVRGVGILRDKHGHLTRMLGIRMDITERKAAEESIRNLSQAVDQSPVSIMITDLKGRIEFVNSNFTRVTGYAHTEVIGQNPNILRSGMTSAEEYRQLWKTISSGKVWRGEFHNRKKNGRMFWEHTTISPVRNENNVITHYMAVKEDVTERKELEEQLRNSQKMEAIGLLAGGIAHDFNNMLNVIIGYAEMIKEYTALDERSQMFIEGILTAGQRSAEITQQLLTFARKQTINPKVLDLNKTVRGMLNLLRRLIGEDIDLGWLPGANIWSVKMEASQIDMILVNLCVNARDAITGIGKITIETKNFSAENLNRFNVYSEETNELLSGEYVMLSVSDNGIGMDKPTVDKIFEPFFTTKPTGKGSGLGLSTMFGIVKQNAGFIKVISKPGSGSTFRIFLPRYCIKDEKAEEERHNNTDSKGKETILLVEDDTLVLNLVTQMLKKYGYTVIPSLTPQEAIRIADIGSVEIDLLLADVVMPGMTGRDLEKKLTAMFPKLKCIFMSGYTGTVIANQDVLDDNVNFIQKPFSQRELAVKIRDVLDNPGHRFISHAGANLHNDS